MEELAIERIRKFSQLSERMGYKPALGFSGGKDSQVVYDLAKRSGITFTAYFNHSFEDVTTLKFIRTYYPEVIWRRDYKTGFIDNIVKHHGGMLPTVYHSYCCSDYKHNPKYADKASITGVRAAESVKRKNRTAFSVKNKTQYKRNKELFTSYFRESCSNLGTSSEIQLLPIVEWSSQDVWDYIHTHKLPINPCYEYSRRVGCVVCPKAGFSSNYIALLKYPKLIDAFIRAIEGKVDWKIVCDDYKSYENDKVYYVCRWLNHSFAPFSKKQEELYRQVKDNYLKHKRQ